MVHSNTARSHTSALLLLLLAAACGGGGPGTGGSTGGGTSQAGTALQLVATSPTDAAVQIPLDSAVRLRFDAEIAAECLADEDTWLEDGRGNRVACTCSLAEAGRMIVVTPATALAEETDYTMHVSALTCDTTGRILEGEQTFGFRTLDHTPPTVVSASLGAGASNVSRTAAQTIVFSEPLAAASLTASTVYLRDTYGGIYPVSPTASGATLAVAPVVDLPGDRAFVLAVLGGTSGVTDRAGNLLARTWTVGFRTAADATAPRVSSRWPVTLASASPRIAPTITFDESMDPGSLEPSTVLFTDQFSSLVAFRVQASADQRTLRLVPSSPLVAGHDYSVVLFGGVTGATDLSGNALAGTTSLSFSVGSDETPPDLLTCMPAPGAVRVSPNVMPLLTFTEPLDPARVSTATVRLLEGSRIVPITVGLAHGNTQVVIAPAAMLKAGTTYTVTLTGGVDGLRDPAGNNLASDQSVGFTTSASTALPSLIVQPASGSTSVPISSKVSIVSDTPLDPATVNSGTVGVHVSGGQAVPGTVTLTGGGRVITFVRDGDWPQGASYVVTVQSGASGVRALTGNWLTQDVVGTFRTGYSRDSIQPTVSLTLNRAADARKRGMIVPPSGFTIDVAGVDGFDYMLDVGTFAVTISGTGPAPSSATILAEATLDASSLHWRLPASMALEPGEYTVSATVRDLSGNVGTGLPFVFKVEAASAGRIPFERTQVVWTRFDLDRDGNGKPDFDDDLYKLGFMTAGDPTGTNDRMRALVRAAYLARANQLFHRSDLGAPLGADSVAIRLTHKRPLGVPAMQIAVGGPDPEGAPNRDYGDDTTGTLGRAYFDAKNSQVNELDIAVRPGLGVFPAEMFLYQTAIHIQVWPAYTTSFARKFLNVCPRMGGTSVGANALDAAVTAPTFDYGNASLQERARYRAIFDAIEDWANAIGVILAHEIGHAVGLVAPGASPVGLHGDASLHDEYASSADVMAASVGYESLVTLEYQFRDLDLAYLRERLLLK